MSDRVEARNVTMYPQQWEVVEKVAQEVAGLIGGAPNVSLGLRQIVDRYASQVPAHVKAELAALGWELLAVVREGEDPMAYLVRDEQGDVELYSESAIMAGRTAIVSGVAG